jgi:CRP-like cAMP-binding protein
MANKDGPKPEIGLLVEILAELRRTNDHLQVLMIPTLRATLDHVLGGAAERRAYEISDGHLGTREVAARAGASAGSVSGWWNKWRQSGVAIATTSGRVRHVLPLSALGMEVPPK